MGVEGEVEDRRLHGEGKGPLVPFFYLPHQLFYLFSELPVDRRVDDKGHPPAGLAAQHQEPPKIPPPALFYPGDQFFSITVRRPGDDLLGPLLPVFGGKPSQLFHITAPDGPHDPIEIVRLTPPRLPLCPVTEEILVGHQFQDRSHVPGQAPVDQNDGLPEHLVDPVRQLFRRDNPVVGQQPPAADPVFRIAAPGPDPFDDLDPGPEAAGVLPTSARPAEPFPQDRPGGDDPPLVIGRLALHGNDLAGHPHQAGDDGRQKRRGDRHPRTPGEIAYPGDQFDPAPASHQFPENLQDGQLIVLEGWRDDPRRDDAGLEEAEVVKIEVEELAGGGDVPGDSQVEGDQPDRRPVDNPAIALNRRPGRTRSPPCDID